MNKTVEMTYVGSRTDTYLWTIRAGQETLTTLKRRRRRYSEFDEYSLSMDEAISFLERSRGIQKSPEELATEIAAYQQAIQNIDREPDAYLAPDIARNWYEQQIERMGLLRKGQA